MRRMLQAVAMTAAVVVPSLHAQAVLSFTVGGDWDSPQRRDAAVASIQAVVNRYNAYGDFGNNNIYVRYHPGIPTAQAGFQGDIGFGGTYPNERVTLHEANHYLGTGTISTWGQLMVNGTWNGAKANAIMEQFDGLGARLHGDAQHHWPYGLNYDNEGGDRNLNRSVALTYAIRQDMNIGNQNLASSSQAVLMSRSDSPGVSSFNDPYALSDKHFAHAGADYYTGNFAMRTPLDSWNPGAWTPDFNFVGKSLTVNNRGNAGAGLIYQGVGQNSILRFNNLVLDGGTVHHLSGAGDLFRIAGRMTVVSASTITPENGSINIQADVSGVGSLTIGDTTIADINNGVVRWMAGNNSFRGNIIVNGRLDIPDGANVKFAVRGSGVNNSISGAAADWVRINGDFEIDLSGASTTGGSFWPLVTATNTTYGSAFSIDGFTEATPGVWNNGNGYVFYETTGLLAYGLGASSEVLPEPTALLALVGSATLGLARRRRAGR